MDKSFEILIKEHRDMMLSYARALLAEGSHQAEDVVQEACIVAYLQLEDFDQSRSFPKWLRGIVRYKVMESQRAWKRQPWVTDPHVIEGMEDVYQTFDQVRIEDNWRDRIALIEKCVSQLNDQMRRTVELVYQFGMPLKAVATEMSTTIMAAGQRLSRARKLIRICVQRQMKLGEV